MSELTQEIVRELLDYDPDTGILTWKERRAFFFKMADENQCAAWNAKYSGSIAGRLHKKTGYWEIIIFKNYYRAHRIIWLWMTGEFPANSVDHINGVRNDNRWENLRAVTSDWNNRNRTRSRSNTSGYRGVSWRKNRNKWEAKIQINGKTKHLGLFDELEVAFNSYVIEARKNGFTDRHIFGKD